MKKHFDYDNTNMLTVIQGQQNMAFSLKTYILARERIYHNFNYLQSKYLRL